MTAPPVSVNLSIGGSSIAPTYRPATGGPWLVLLNRLPSGQNVPMLAGAMDLVGKA